MVTMATLGIQGLYSKERLTKLGKNDSRRARRFSLNLCKAGDNVYAWHAGGLLKNRTYYD